MANARGPTGLFQRYDRHTRADHEGEIIDFRRHASRLERNRKISDACILKLWDALELFSGLVNNLVLKLRTAEGSTQQLQQMVTSFSELDQVPTWDSLIPDFQPGQTRQQLDHLQFKLLRAIYYDLGQIIEHQRTPLLRTYKDVSQAQCERDQDIIAVARTFHEGDISSDDEDDERTREATLWKRLRSQEMYELERVQQPILVFLETTGLHLRSHLSPYMDLTNARAKHGDNTQAYLSNNEGNVKRLAAEMFKEATSARATFLGTAVDQEGATFQKRMVQWRNVLVFGTTSLINNHIKNLEQCGQSLRSQGAIGDR